MVRQGTKQINLTMSAEKHSVLEKAWKESETEKPISGWILENMMMEIEIKGLMKTYAPFLSKKSVDGNSVVLRDEKLKRLVEVTYTNKKFWCDHDEKDCCVHVHFALTLPELSKLKR